MFHPANTPDMLTFLHQYGPAWFAFLCVVCSVLYLAYRYVVTWFSRADKCLVKLETGLQKLDQGQVVLHEMRDAAHRFDAAFSKHMADVERISCEEHWRNCPIEKCPYLHNLSSRLEAIYAEIAAYHDDAKEDRTQIKEALDIVMRRFDGFATQIIAVLRRNGSE